MVVGSFFACLLGGEREEGHANSQGSDGHIVHEGPSNIN